MIDTLCHEPAMGDRRDAGSRWHGEPRVEELLSDPVMQMVMHCDRVGEDELTRLIQGVRQTLGTS